MRYLLLVLSALWLVARALAHHVRRRAARVRRYVARPAAPDPNLVRGPIPLITPRMASGVEAPPLPERPALPWERAASVEPVDVLRRGCADWSWLGAAVFLAISEPREERRPGRHRAAVVV